MIIHTKLFIENASQQKGNVFLPVLFTKLKQNFVKVNFPYFSIYINENSLEFCNLVRKLTVKSLAKMEV